MAVRSDGPSGGKGSVTVTDELPDFPKCLELTLAEVRKKDASITPDLCCISGAGPVKDNFCKLSNSTCDVDGNEIEKRIGVKTLIINDFLKELFF